MREVTECRWIVAVLPVTVIVNVDVWFAVGHVHAECTEVHTIFRRFHLREAQCRSSQHAFRQVSDIK